VENDGKGLARLHTWLSLRAGHHNRTNNKKGYMAAKYENSQVQNLASLSSSRALSYSCQIIGILRKATKALRAMRFTGWLISVVRQPGSFFTLLVSGSPYFEPTRL
jgi:hypothetical protein